MRTRVSAETGYYRGVEFCNRFDEQLALNGPPGVFLFDHKGRLRFDASWTRDVWQRADEHLDGVWRWALFRDRDSGYVQIALVTSSNLLTEHPRLDIRLFEKYADAEAARGNFGNPPVSRDPWSR